MWRSSGLSRACQTATFYILRLLFATAAPSDIADTDKDANCKLTGRKGGNLGGRIY